MMRCRILIRIGTEGLPINELSAPVELTSCETLTAAPPVAWSISKIFKWIASRIAANRAGYIMLLLVLRYQCIRSNLPSAQPILCMASLGVSSAAVN